MNSFHFERALFVLGNQHAGKSVQLRSMQKDIRFGTDGRIPAKGSLRDIYQLSNERILYLRLTSPHEAGESLIKGDKKNFLMKTLGKLQNHHSKAGRWNFASALQPSAMKRMPDAYASIQAFTNFFRPERVRVVILSPNCSGVQLQPKLLPLARNLQSISSVEVCWIDATSRSSNGFFLADFFDFS